MSPGRKGPLRTSGLVRSHPSRQRQHRGVLSMERVWPESAPSSAELASIQSMMTGAASSFSGDGSDSARSATVKGMGYMSTSF
ncbi:hypothetical protein NL676_034288 [Syzygium grande]|nr:hypothetical protein NL676_034288 [Syzygium grande]